MEASARRPNKASLEHEHEMAWLRSFSQFGQIRVSTLDGSAGQWYRAPPRAICSRNRDVSPAILPTFRAYIVVREPPEFGYFFLALTAAVSAGTIFRAS